MNSILPAINSTHLNNIHNNSPQNIHFTGLSKANINACDKLILSKSPIEEFFSYLEKFDKHGEQYTPTSSNPKSLFIEYFNYRDSICQPKEINIFGKITLLKPKNKILENGNNPKSRINALNNFLDFVETKSQNSTSETYKELLSDIAALMPAYVKKQYPSLRPEIAENADKIYKWRKILGSERKNESGEIIHTRFYKKEEYDKALTEYTGFLEDITGKKVLVGSPSRMRIGVEELGMFNDPENYKDIDYILLGHGKGSSLEKDIKSPNSWHFSDSGKSVWEFIEENVPKGRKILVGVCEEDGLSNSQRKAIPEMYDKSGKYKFGIGQAVISNFSMSNPMKIVESGNRQIIGHKYIKDGVLMDNAFIGSCTGKAITQYYSL